MLRRYANILVIGAVSILLVLGFILYLYYATQPNRKPTPIEPSTPKKIEQNYNWYMQFSVKQQKATAYTEEPGAPLAANAANYYIGGVAVHPRYPLHDGGSAIVPIIPFGTIIHFNAPITVQGQKLSSMTVIDTGDVNYGLWPSYPYWFDIFWGSTNYYNNKSAREYGTDLVDYYWYEPWE